MNKFVTCCIQSHICERQYSCPCAGAMQRTQRNSALAEIHPGPALLRQPPQIQPLWLLCWALDASMALKLGFCPGLCIPQWGLRFLSTWPHCHQRALASFRRVLNVSSPGCLCATQGNARKIQGLVGPSGTLGQTFQGKEETVGSTEKGEKEEGAPPSTSQGAVGVRNGAARMQTRHLDTMPKAIPGLPLHVPCQPLC